MENTSIGTGHEGSINEQIRNYWQRVRAGDMGSLPAVGALLFLAALFSTTSESFLTRMNFANLFVQSAELMMLAAALVFVLLLGEIDLSAGVTAGVGMAIFYTLFHGGLAWPIALLAGFAFGALVGYIIGFFVAKIGVPSFVVTLGFFLGFQGLQLVLLGAGGQFLVFLLQLFLEPFALRFHTSETTTTVQVQTRDHTHFIVHSHNLWFQTLQDGLNVCALVPWHTLCY